MISPPPGHGLLIDKTAVVTAAAGTGIGAAIAERFLLEGARVVISDQHERRLAEAAERLGTPSFPCDVTEQSDVDGLLAAALDAFGHVDVWVNNAGLGGTADLVSMTDEEWNRILDVTLNGCFRGTRAALAHMVPRRDGVIVNNASVLGWRAQRGQAHYSAAKAGVIALTKSLGKELATTGVLINCITPAVIQTDILKQVAQGHIDYMLAKIPMGRFGLKEEAAALAAWLCSADCSFSTGAVFDLSGGRATY